MRPSKKPFQAKKSEYDEIDAMIANAMNNKQPAKGYRAPSQSQNEDEQKEIKNISLRPQFNLRKGGNDQGRDSPYQESTEDITQSQADSSQNSMFRPTKMTFKKSTATTSKNDIEALIQGEMNNKPSGLKKPSAIESLKPNFTKKPITKPTSDINIEDSQNNDSTLNQGPNQKPLLGRPRRNQDNISDVKKQDDVDQEIISSIKPFGKKDALNPSRGLRSQQQNQPVQEQDQIRSNSQTKTINIKRNIELKIKQQTNYTPIQNPILLNQQESDEYSEQFEDYVEDKPKESVSLRPNLPINEKGAINWKEREILLQKQKEQEEIERKQRELEEEKRKEMEEERRQEEKRQLEERRRQEEMRKDEIRRQQIQQQDFMNIQNPKQSFVPGFSSNQPGLLVERQNIFQEPSFIQQNSLLQNNFDQVPRQPAVQQMQQNPQVKGKTRPVLKEKYRDETNNSKLGQQEDQFGQKQMQQAQDQEYLNQPQKQQQQEQQQQQGRRFGDKSQNKPLQQVSKQIQQQQQQQEIPNQNFDYSNPKNQRQQVEEEENTYYNNNNFNTKEVKLQPQYNPKGVEYIEGDEIKINLNINNNQMGKAVPLAKVETQQERVKELRNLIQLELDTFETLFELQPTTEYEIYINKIKAGTLKNSADQSDDNRVTQDIQVDLFQQNEFGNQYPEDQTRTFLKTNVSVSEGSTQTETVSTNTNNNTTKNLDDTTKLIEFMNNTYPIFEEILNLEKQNNNPNNMNEFFSEDIKRYPLPKHILEKFKIQGIRATLNDFRDTYICYDVIQEGVDWFRISLIIKYTNFRITKYCLSQSQVSSLAISNNILIAGTKDGSLNLWDLRETDFSHQKVTNKYTEQIKEGLERDEDLQNTAPTSSKSLNQDEEKFEAQIAFRFPSFTTEYLAQNANLLLNETESVQHSSSVVKIQINTKNNQTLEFFSLEEFGKVIVWNLLELSSSEAERNYIEFGKYTKIKIVSLGAINLSSQIFMNPDSLCYDIQLDSQENNLYICSSLGIIKADKFGTNKIKHPRVFGENRITSFPTSLFVSNETELLAAGYSDGSIKIYSKNFKDPLLTLSNFTRSMISRIFVNEQTNKISNKRYYDINRLIAADSKGNVFIFDLSVNQSAPIKTYQQISKVDASQKKAVSVQNIPERNAVEIFIQDEQNFVNSFKWSYDDLMEKNPKKIFEDMKKFELIIPTYYHDFDFGEENEILI